MKHIITFIFIILVNIVAAQPISWVLSGNTPTATDFLGTTNSQSLNIKTEANHPIFFYTNAGAGTLLRERMVIDANGTSGASGYVGIGNNFTTPRSRLHVSQGSDSTCWFQMTGNQMGSLASDGLRIGVHNPPGGPYHVEIRQQEPSSDILFFTTGVSGTAERVRMLSNGHVGIGTAVPFANSLLDVNGSLALGSQAKIYSRGSANNNFRAFTVSGGSTGDGNTSAGHFAGPASLANIQFNTFLGNNAGTNDSANFNVFIGEQAGQSFVGFPGVKTTENTFISYFAAQAMVSGRQNFIAGASAGLTLDKGNFNTVVGNVAAQSSDSLDNSTVIGNNAGASIKYGKNNTMLGFNSGSNITLANRYHATALGAEARVDRDTCVIVGSQADHVGIGFATTPDSTRLYVNAFPFAHAFTTNGDAYVNSQYLPSDQSIKTNIQPATNAQDILNSLTVFTYSFNNANAPQLNLPSGNQVGIMASDVQAIAPQLVKTFDFPADLNPNGTILHPAVSINTVNYAGLIPYLIQSLKHQKEMIDTLQAQLNGCCPGNRITGSSNSGSIELADMATLQLLQNDPNPFSESTTIKFNIPDDFQNAVIYFYDNSGNKINTYNITAKGANELQVFGSKLSSGIYTYSLVVDGKMIDSKKMVKSSR